MKKIRFIDCGANVGQSIDWALDTFKDYDLHIDSFEPLPLNFNVLTEKYNNSPLVTLHQAAISHSDGTAEFYCQNWGARTGSSLVKGKASTTKNDICEVETINLLRWLNENVNENETVILKIDIEGAEFELLPVLLDNNLHSNVKYWLVEFHYGKNIPGENKEILERLTESVEHLFDWGKMDEVNEFKQQLRDLL